MKKLLAAALTALGLSTAANAAVITLESQTGSASNFTYNYQGTLGPDEGVVAGNRLIIFDFAGYIPGSIFTPAGSVVGTTELSSATPFITPGQTDDPTITNLVFTYTGTDFRATGGPLASFDFNGLGARSVFGTTRFDAFTTFTVKNNPANEAGSALVQLGTVQVPLTGAVPEPAAWALMIGGFGLVGGTVRRRRRSSSYVTA